jgi:hypothetical protein
MSEKHTSQNLPEPASSVKAGTLSGTAPEVLALLLSSRPSQEPTQVEASDDAELPAWLL